MPYIEILNVYIVNCNTIDMQTQSKYTYNEMEHENKYTHNTQETGIPNKYNIIKAGIPKSNNEDKPKVTDIINSKINYFIAGSPSRS